VCIGDIDGAGASGLIDKFPRFVILVAVKTLTDKLFDQARSLLQVRCYKVGGSSCSV
jgi:hypothetical protein